MSVRARWLLAASLAVAAGLAYEVVSTGAVRGALRTFTDLVQVGNRTDLGDEERLAVARGLCSGRYLATHALAVSPEGGIVGLPRAIDKNFVTWRKGPDVWICPTRRTSRVRPVYRFRWEGGRWRFDGPIGVLGPGGEVVAEAEDATGILEAPHP
ncbi:hypothetical protein [Aquisphaera insulae]|uniref:hypothetical protein n=1 Tax=Aquisphaera insulae TaxID=2712864 RepID=UPI0013EAA5BE|nr:hypothetical protein [Aquisphaera insulae]